MLHTKENPFHNARVEEGEMNTNGLPGCLHNSDGRSTETNRGHLDSACYVHIDLIHQAVNKYWRHFDWSSSRRQDEQPLNIPKKLVKCFGLNMAL